MDYTKSVYLPEVALHQSKDFQEKTSKGDLLKRAGVDAPETDESIIVQMMKQLKAQKE